MDSLLGRAQPTTSRGRFSWLGALPLLARHIARTMPWLTLIGGCLAGTGFLVLMTHLTHGSQMTLSQGTVRFAFLPVVAALAFLLRCPFRPLIQVTPVPAWVTPATHALVAVPIIGATCWMQLRILASTFPVSAEVHPPAVYPLVAQLVGWCAATVAVAAWVDRSRFADLGGAVGLPVSFAVIGLAWYVPASHKFLASPPAAVRELTVAWYVITVVALVLAGAAMRDQWHRYATAVRRHAVERVPI
jgi:hypothetical protein